MREKLSIEAKCFEQMRRQLDYAMERTVYQALNMGSGECSIGLKLNIEFAGVELESGKTVPVFKYKITHNIPMKGEHKSQVQEHVTLDVGKDGLECVMDQEQTKFA